MSKITIAGMRCSTTREAAQFEPLILAKSYLLAKQPFFAALLLDRMRIVLSDDCPTAATDGRTIIIGPKFFESLSLQQRVFVLCHEVMHAIFRHCPRAKAYMRDGFRGKKFRPDVWNIAADVIINGLLVAGQVGDMPQNALQATDVNAEEYAVEPVYAKLMENMPPLPPGGVASGDASGDGDGSDPSTSSTPSFPGVSGEQFDEHLTPTYQESDVVEREIQQAVKSAAETAKAQGKMPSSLEQFVSDFSEPQVDWRTLLRTTLTKAIAKDEATWSRPHRKRLVSQGIYTPGRTGFGAGEVWVWMDTSGSISESEYAAYFGELTDILSTCRPETLMLGFCDAAVNRVERLDMAEDLEEQAKRIPGGGGTDFRPPFAYMEREDAQPDAVVYLTDMYGSFPEECPWPTIWVATSDEIAPFGETIKLTLDQD